MPAGLRPVGRAARWRTTPAWPTASSACARADGRRAPLARAARARGLAPRPRPAPVPLALHHAAVEPDPLHRALLPRPGARGPGAAALHRGGLGGLLDRSRRRASRASRRARCRWPSRRRSGLRYLAGFGGSTTLWAAHADGRHKFHGIDDRLDRARAPAGPAAGAPGACRAVTRDGQRGPRRWSTRRSTDRLAAPRDRRSPRQAARSPAASSSRSPTAPPAGSAARRGARRARGALLLPDGPAFAATFLGRDQARRGGGAAQHAARRRRPRAPPRGRRGALVADRRAPPSPRRPGASRPASPGRRFRRARRRRLRGRAAAREPVAATRWRSGSTPRGRRERRRPRCTATARCWPAAGYGRTSSASAPATASSPRRSSSSPTPSATRC